MTENEYREIDEAIDKAQESVVPFPIATDDELLVAGDANATQINAHDFKITFRVPSKDGYKTYVKEFNDIYITPRQNPVIVKAMTGLLPYFKKPNADGSVTEYSREEKVRIFSNISQEVYDSMYDMVAAVLHIGEELKDYMSPASVLEATANILRQYPEMVNEADTFFG